LALHQQAADQLRGNHLGRASEEGVGEVLGVAGRAWWLWGWLCEEVLRDAEGGTKVGYKGGRYFTFWKCQKSNSTLHWMLKVQNLLRKERRMLN
jgi:hypothetical protein